MFIIYYIRKLINKYIYRYSEEEVKILDLFYKYNKYGKLRNKNLYFIYEFNIEPINVLGTIYVNDKYYDVVKHHNVIKLLVNRIYFVKRPHDWVSYLNYNDRYRYSLFMEKNYDLNELYDIFYDMIPLKFRRMKNINKILNGL